MYLLSISLYVLYITQEKLISEDPALEPIIMKKTKLQHQIIQVRTPIVRHVLGISMHHQEGELN